MSFPKYEAYKDSGEEWLGEVPEHWLIIKINHVISKITNGYVGPTRNILVDYGVRYIQSLHIKDGKIQFERGAYFVEDSWSQSHQKSILNEDDVLLVQTGDIGQTALVTSVHTDCNCHALIIMSPIPEKLRGAFLELFLRSHVGQNVLKTIQTGALHPHLNCSLVKDIKLALPPIREQDQLVDFLNRETTRIDALIAEQQRLIELLKEKRQAVISHAVTKGIDPTVPMKDSGVEWLGEVPAHWEVRRLKHSSTIVDCKNRTPEYFDDGEFLVVRTSNVKKQKLNLDGAYYTNRQNFKIWTERGIPPVGSILFTREAPTGEVCLVPDGVPLCLGQRMMNIIPNDRAFTQFLFDFLTSDCLTKYIESQSAGSTVTHLRVEQIYNIPIVVPPQSEQFEIDELVGKMKAQFFDLIDSAQKSVLLLQERRSALISAAVTGKIDVRNASAPASA